MVSMRNGILVALCLAANLSWAQSSAVVTARVAAKAREFLATLDEAGRAKIQFRFDDAEQRKRWSNLPTGIFERKGLSLGQMTAAQRGAALAILEAALSPAGYQKTVGILEADEALRPTAPNPRIRFGKDEYYISFLGAPSEKEPWAIQFGGHHLALNLLLVGGKGILTPSHTAAQPARFTLNGNQVRPLGAENDKAFALLGSLNEAQKKKAILAFEIRDLVLGPLNDGKTIEPEGLPASEMNAAQREMLLGLAEEWVGMLEKSVAAERMRELRGQVNAMWFAWSGATENGKAAYFRIQGPTVVIEYSPQTLGGDATQHIHTMYRDPSNDYGRKILAQ
jgi:hypothetical protein